MCGQYGHVKKNCQRPRTSSPSDFMSVYEDTGNEANVLSISPQNVISSENGLIHPHGILLNFKLSR